ncbi:hypothetical protein DFJ74DRAFT_663334 [Hyaloraphidium curvatum]|nr:hypothetical protein DFJ74DRAFT_663334 [Hyaloraphidium curvatum]
MRRITEDVASLARDTIDREGGGDDIKPQVIWFDQAPLRIQPDTLQPKEGAVRVNDDGSLRCWSLMDEAGKPVEITFGTLKPDLIEITLIFKPPEVPASKPSPRRGEQAAPAEPRNEWSVEAHWKVLDAKSSKKAKETHMVQIALYHLVLSELFKKWTSDAKPTVSYVGHQNGAVWLPWMPSGTGDGTVPPPNALEPFPVGLVVPQIRGLLECGIPRVLRKAFSALKWHFNPVCQTCDFRTACRQIAKEEERIGSLPGISIMEEAVLQRARPHAPGKTELKDIEDMVEACTDGTSQGRLRSDVRRILKVSGSRSPLIEAHRHNVVTVYDGYNTSLPSGEHLAIFIALSVDPSSEDYALDNDSPASIGSGSVFGILAGFAIRCSLGDSHPPCNENFGSLLGEAHVEERALTSTTASSDLAKSLVKKLSEILRVLKGKDSARCQFYCWSSREVQLLNRIIIAGACQLWDGPAREEWLPLQEDLRLCTAALVTDTAAMLSPFVPSFFRPDYHSGLYEAANRLRMTKLCTSDMADVLLAVHQRLRMANPSMDCQIPKSNSASRLKDDIRSLLSNLENKCPAKDEDGPRFPKLLALEPAFSRTVCLPVAGWLELPDYCKWFELGGQPEGAQSQPAPRLGSQLHVLRELTERVRDRVRNARRHHSDPRVVGPELAFGASHFFLSSVDRAVRDRNLQLLWFMAEHEQHLELNDVRSRGQLFDSEAGYVIEVQRDLVDAGALGADSNAIRILRRPDKEPELKTKDVVPGKKHAVFANYVAVPSSLISGQWTVPEVFRRFRNLQWASRSNLAYKNAPWLSKRMFFATSAANHAFGAENPAALVRGDKGHRIPHDALVLQERLCTPNYGKVLANLFILDCSAESLFCRLVREPARFGPGQNDEPSDVKDWTRRGMNIDDSWRMRKQHGSESSSLQLTPSQKSVYQSVLSSRLTVVWGPPGSGKTHTLAVVCTRLLHTLQAWQEQAPAQAPRTFRILFAASTHAAVDTFLRKLFKVIQDAKATDNSTSGHRWSEHAAQNVIHVLSHGFRRGERMTDLSDEEGEDSIEFPQICVCAGTVWAVYNNADKGTLLKDLSKADKGKQKDLAKADKGSLTNLFDLVIIDEASQMPVAHAAIPISVAKPEGSRIIVAGDHLQLAPILRGMYPLFPPSEPQLSGSFMECVMKDKDGNNVLVGSLLAGLRPRAKRTVAVEGEIGRDKAGVTHILRDNFRMSDGLAKFTERAYNQDFVAANKDARQTRCDKIIKQLVRKLEPGESTLSAEASGFFTRLDNEPTSLATIALTFDADTAASASYETHVERACQVVRELVEHLWTADGSEEPGSASPEKDPLRIFIVTPHTIQKETYKRLFTSGTETHARLNDREKLRIDTTETMQGDEADIVIVDYGYTSYMCNATVSDTELDFTWKHNRLHVAISRAKSLCILIAPRQLLYLSQASGPSGPMDYQDNVGPPLNVVISPERRRAWALLNDFACESRFVYSWQVDHAAVEAAAAAGSSQPHAASAGEPISGENHSISGL